MRIDTFCDLKSAWEASTMLGKIFFFWLFGLGWIGIFIVSMYLMAVTEIGVKVGFMNLDDES